MVSCQLRKEHLDQLIIVIYGGGFSELQSVEQIDILRSKVWMLPRVAILQMMLGFALTYW